MVATGGSRPGSAIVGRSRLIRAARDAALETRAGARLLAGPRSKLRWAVDVVLYRVLIVMRLPTYNRPRTIRLRGGGRLQYRLNRGDIQAMREVWLDETYRLPADIGPVRTVVDLGANIGLASVYLCRRHDSRRLVAVEPVPANAALARENLALNGIDADVLEAAVAATDGTVHFQLTEDSNLGRIAPSGRAVRAISMHQLLERLPARTEIDILKIDIEGGEQELLLGDRSWLRRVRSIIVEFHPAVVDNARLIAVLQREGFEFIASGSIHPHSADTFVRRG
jgi:FkbM family methyltransferase